MFWAVQRKLTWQQRRVETHTAPVTSDASHSLIYHYEKHIKGWNVFLISVWWHKRSPQWVASLPWLVISDSFYTNSILKYKWESEDAAHCLIKVVDDLEVSVRLDCKSQSFRWSEPDPSETKHQTPHEIWWFNDHLERILMQLQISWTKSIMTKSAAAVTKQKG